MHFLISIFGMKVFSIVVPIIATLIAFCSGMEQELMVRTAEAGGGKAHAPGLRSAHPERGEQAMPVVTSSSVTPAAPTATTQGLSFLDRLFSLKKEQRFNPDLFPEELSGEAKTSQSLNSALPDEAAPFSHGVRKRKRHDSGSHLSLEGLSRGEGTPETLGPNRQHGVRLNGLPRGVSLGTFSTPEEAAKAYVVAKANPNTVSQARVPGPWSTYDDAKAAKERASEHADRLQFPVPDELPPYSPDDGSGFPLNSEGLEQLFGGNSDIDEVLGIHGTADAFDFDGNDYYLSEEEEQGTKARERQAKIAKFLEKRKHRVWTKKVVNHVRKAFADRRPRVAGRFIPGAAAKRQRM